jgi:hypothetical protein
MQTWILAHGSGIDDLVVFAAAAALVLAVRRGAGRRRAPEDPEEPTDE